MITAMQECWNEDEGWNYSFHFSLLCYPNVWDEAEWIVVQLYQTGVVTIASIDWFEFIYFLVYNIPYQVRFCGEYQKNAVQIVTRKVKADLTPSWNEAIAVMTKIPITIYQIQLDLFFIRIVGIMTIDNDEVTAVATKRNRLYW